MKTITPLAGRGHVAAGGLRPDIARGSMTFMLVFVAVMLAVAIYEARSNRRGAIGWIVNIVAAACGGLLAATLIGMAVDAMLPCLQFEGSLASSQKSAEVYRLQQLRRRQPKPIPFAACD